MAADTFPILPPGADPLDSTAALSLQDALADPDAELVETTPPVPLGRTPAMDLVERRFVPNNRTGGPLMLYGLDTLQQWVEKCLRTRRGDNVACNPEFGVDRLLLDITDGQPMDDSAAAEYEAIVGRALSVHPAIASVENWTWDFDDDSDAATAGFTVMVVRDGQEPEELDITVPVGG